jgi:hypothetical protein
VFSLFRASCQAAHISYAIDPQEQGYKDSGSTVGSADNFGDVAIVLVGAVLLVCIVPYFVFTPVLLQIRRRGQLRYGAFARAMGEQFE